MLQTSTGRLQAWIQISASPLEPAVTTAIARQLACAYGGDRASADGRHLGRLAGFTNQKPARRQYNGYAPWVRVVYAQPGLATSGAALVDATRRPVASAPSTIVATGSLKLLAAEPELASCNPAAAGTIYLAWLNRLHIPQRFPRPDWSIVDKWIAKELLRQGTPAALIQTLLRWGSPGFPRGHANPEDYLKRTLARARGELLDPTFPAPARGAPCVPDRSNSSSQIHP